MKPFFVSPKPKRFGENDVDTVIHTLLVRLADSNDVFEGMCNPPGGDWSGLSLLSVDRKIEQRWLTLPRVSRTGTKRPDHVFQLFNVLPRPIILCVESKELPRSVEDEIGPQVVAYVANLLVSPSSVERASTERLWSFSERRLNVGDFKLASAAAFISCDPMRIAEVRKRASVDLLFCFEFEDSGGHCTIGLLPTSEVGKAIANFICATDLSNYETSLKFLH